MKIGIKKFKKFLEKLSLSIAQHAFLACLFLFLLSLIFGGFLFYKYSILAQKVEPEALDRFVLLKEGAYQEVLGVWQEHERISQEADFKEYPNPFLESVPFPEVD
ncbi:hypothetical protein KJA13_03645 [Patescibacteria group bacterium]|nr:hypothetical protein [Patescibacteria group bacterium]